MELMKRKNSVKYSLLTMATVPVLLLGFLVICISVKRFETALYDEVEGELSGMAHAVSNMLDIAYPGDYVKYGDKILTLVKGESILNDRSQLIDSIKEDTGFEMSIFYSDIRFLTTILNHEGDRILGTNAHIMVQNDVLNEGKAKFYNNVEIGEERYFAYYLPLFNSDEKCVGMIGVAKSAGEVNKLVYSAVLPIIAVGALVMILTGCVTIRYSTKLIKDLTKLRTFMKDVAGGNFRTEFDYMLMKRDDEITDMCSSASDMQKSLKKLIEQDPLTQLENRRSADRSLKEMQKAAAEKGEKFIVVLGDIDFFKTVNDTYGHDAGDEVLKMVAQILKRHMKGKGFAARWGGEEFLLGYSGYNMDETEEATMRILEEIRDSHVEYDSMTISVTMSFGIASGGGKKTIDDIIKRADECLYAAKEGGRNRIVSDAEAIEEQLTEKTENKTIEPAIDKDIIDYIREINEDENGRTDIQP